MERSYFLIGVIFSCVIFSFSKGNTIFSIQGEDKNIEWTILPPPGDVFVHILYPSGEVLFSAIGKAVIPGSGSISDRVTNTGNTNTNTGHIEFTLNNVRVTDAGNYSARYQLSGRPGSFRIGASLVVYVKPSKPVLTEVIPPVVGQEMVLQCIASSNSKPDGHGLNMTYKWYINSVHLPTDSTEHQLRVKNIQKSDNDLTFTCKGYETPSLLSDVSDTFTSDVKYGPMIVTLSPDTVHYTKEENSSIGTIICGADCHPPCTYQWKFNGRDIGRQGNTLTINNILNEEAGTYWCAATNTHGSKDSNKMNLEVVMSPINTIVTILKGGNVTESGSVTIQCATNSRPRSNITIYGNNLTTLYYQQDVLSVMYTIPHLNCVDSGTIYCVAENNYGNSEVNVTLNIPCYPRPEDKASSLAIQSLDIGGNVDMIGVFVANPLPEIEWRFRKDKDDSSIKLINKEFRVFNHQNNTSISSQASIRHIESKDFGEYILSARNKYGEARIVFYVKFHGNHVY